jgi:cysteine-rich repeat protein
MTSLLLLLLVVSPASAALVEPYAGGGIGDGLPALDAPLQPMGVAVDADGNLFVADQATARIRRIDGVTGLVSTIVGGDYGWCGYEGPGTDICLSEPRGLSVDADGDVWFGEATGSVFRWDASTGQVTHVGGRNLYDATCVDGESVPAAQACLGGEDVVPDGAGGAFALSEHRVHHVSGGVATRYAGCGAPNGVVSGEGGPATAACLGFAQGLDVEADGDLLIATMFDDGRVWRVDADTGIITRVAGGSTDFPACFDDEGPATDACLFPRDVTVDADGNFFTLGFQGAGIRRVDADTQQLTHVTPGPGEWQIDAAPDGFLYTAGVAHVYRVDPAGGSATVVAGNGSTTFCGEDVPATQACLAYPHDIAGTADGTLFVADHADDGRIRRVDPVTGVITTVAAGRVCREAPGIDPDQVCFNERVVLAATPGGELYLADEHGNDDDGLIQLVRRLDPETGALTTIAGRCTQNEPSGIPAIDACVGVGDLAADADGNLFLAEWSRVRRIDAASGEITTIAGSGQNSCPAGNDPEGPALDACIGAKRVTLAPDGTLYIVSDAGNGYDVVLRHDAAAETLTRVAGRTDDPCTRVADGAPATAGCMQIQSLSVDAGGNLLVGSRGVVRLIEAASHVVTTLAGRVPDPDGFDPCCEACSNPPACLRATDLAFDPEGRLLAAEPDERQVQRITLTCGNGVVEEDEECDDGNLVSGDGCDASCQTSRCGAPLAPPACSGQLVPRSLVRAFDRSCTIEGKLVEAETPRQLRRAERSLARTLRWSNRQLGRAARRGLLDQACVDALRAAFE